MVWDCIIAYRVGSICKGIVNAGQYTENICSNLDNASLKEGLAYFSKKMLHTASIIPAWLDMTVVQTFHQ